MTPGSGPSILVENLGANQAFHMINFSVGSFGGPSGDTIRIDNSDGRVWLEEFFVDAFVGHGMRVTDSPNVLLSEVFLQVNSAHTDLLGNHLPSAGLTLEAGSKVDAFGCDISGSGKTPLFVSPTFPIPGGDAVVVVDSTLRLTRCSLRGGTGGSVLIGACSIAAEGGSALRVLTQGGSAPSVELLGGIITAGSPGPFTPSCAPTPSIAPAIDDPLGAVVTVPGPARTLAMPSQPTPLGTFEFQVQGAPGDQWFLFASVNQVNATPLPGIVGSLFIDPTTAIQPLSGTTGLGGFGGKVVNFPNPGFPIIFHAQALFLDQQGKFWVSGPGSHVSL